MSIRMINYIFLIIIVLLPLQFALNVSENVDLVTTRILIPVVFLLWLVRGLARKEIRIPNRAETWLILSFLFLSLLSLALGRDADAGLRKLLYIFSIVPVFFVAADIFREEKWRRRGFLAVIIGGTAAAAAALVQFSLPFLVGLGKAVAIWEGLAPYFLGNYFGKIVAANSSWLVNVGGKTAMRAFGFFPDPHNFAFFTNLCLFSGLGCFFLKRKTISKIWIGPGLALMTSAVVLSFSRGAYLGLLAGLFFFAVVYLKRSGGLGKAAVAGSAIVILILVFNSGAISQRLASSFNLKEGSNAERCKNWVQAAEIIRDWPVGGVGLGNYARTVDPTAPDRSSIYAHNLFLDVAAETGILNAIIFLSLLFISVWRNTRSGGMIGLGVAAGLVGFFVHSIFDTALWSPQVLTVLLVIIAMGVHVNNLKTQSAKLKITT